MVYNDTSNEHMATNNSQYARPTADGYLEMYAAGFESLKISLGVELIHQQWLERFGKK